MVRYKSHASYDCRTHCPKQQHGNTVVSLTRAVGKQPREQTAHQHYRNANQQQGKMDFGGR